MSAQDEEVPREVIEHELIRISGRAWGVASGLLAGLTLFTATIVLVFKGGDSTGAHLGRLSKVMPGYDVTVLGSFIGFVYFFVLGYGLGRFLSPRHSLPSAAVNRWSTSRHPQLSAHVWGLAFALLGGVGLGAVTIALVLLGGENVGPFLRHFSIYLPGYSVSLVGGLVGGIWLAALGYVLGRSIAVIYNRMVASGA